jgi:hypothetical protein
MTINKKLPAEWVRSNLTSRQRHTALDNLFNYIFSKQLFLNGVTPCISHGTNTKDFMQQIRPIKTITTRKPKCLVFIEGGVWWLLTPTVQWHRILILTSKYTQRSKGTTYTASFLVQHLDTELIYQYCNYIMSPLHFLIVHGMGSFTSQQNSPKFLCVI